MVSEDCVAWLESMECMVRVCGERVECIVKVGVCGESWECVVWLESVWCGWRVCGVVGVDGERVESLR